jgi:hypothetical protein
MRRRIGYRPWRIAVALLLLVSTTAGSASAQVCATICLIYYGRFTIQDGEVYWYSSCTTEVIGNDTHYNCRYKKFAEMY